MSERFENSIREWYEKSHTSNLAYLDLAETQKPTLHSLHHNLSVVYDRLSLFSRVSLKHFKQILEENQLLKIEVSQLRQHLSNLETEFHISKPLSKTEIRELIIEIAKQPKLVEEQTIKLAEDLKVQVRKIESLLQEVQRSISG